MCILSLGHICEIHSTAHPIDRCMVGVVKKQYPATFSFAKVVALFLFVSLFNCSRQRVAKPFTQYPPLDKGSGYVVPEHSAMPTQYVALVLRRVPHIFLDIYIYPRARKSQISMVFVSVGLASLAQIVAQHFFRELLHLLHVDHS